MKRVKACKNAVYEVKWELACPHYLSMFYESISQLFSLSCVRRSVAEPCSRHFAANAAGAI